MRKLHRFQISIAIFLGAFFVVIAYELRKLIVLESNLIQSAIVISISFILSSIAANFFTNLLVRIKRLRQRLFKDHWIEGFWYNTDESQQDSTTLLNATAITEIKFRDASLGFQTVGYRILDNKEIFTFSQYVTLIGPNNLYINFTTSSAKGAFRSLIATGYFFKSPGSDYIDTYEGVVTDLDGEYCYRQRAIKVSDKKAKALKKEYGRDWVKEILNSHETKKESLSKKKDK